MSDFNTDQPVQPVQAFIKSATSMYPDSQLAYVYIDVYRPQGAVKVFLSRDPEQSLTWMEDVVAFHPATLEVLSDISTSKLNAVERVSLALYSIHFGDFGGLTVKVFWCIIGLVPALLTVTRYLMWWNRVLKKKWSYLKSPKTDTREDCRWRPASETLSSDNTTN